jgi:diguanylate cyclase (GGDEF)-like protein
LEANQQRLFTEKSAKFNTSGEKFMSSSSEYTFFNASLDPGQPPICDAIRELLAMTNGEVRLGEVKGSSDGSNEVIVVDAGVDSAHSQLVGKTEESELRAEVLLSDSENEIPSAAETERRLNIGESRRVLVAEHDKNTRLDLERRLQEWGFDAVTVKNGEDALSILKRRPPELAILNRRLPGIDGMKLCRRINDWTKECSPYIFILGDRNERQDIVSALEAGAADYLNIPVDCGELRARLIVASRILRRQQSLISSRDEFRAQARNDSLTGVWNRRAILEILEDELNSSSRDERSTGVLLVDLDHFKRVNDLYGHLVGDLVLRETSCRLSRALRSYDFVGRYGGEEFLVVVPGSNQSELCELAERIRAAMACEPVLAGENKLRVTLSVGATIATEGEKSTSSVIAVADAALYKAKRIGRNRTAYGARRSNGIFKTGLSLNAVAAL